MMPTPGDDNQSVDPEATRLPVGGEDPEGTRWRSEGQDPEGTKWRPESEDPEGTRWKPGTGEATPTGSYTPSVAPGRHFKPGRFGEYELLAEIARGGMGVVYKAKHVSSGRVVALKMIPPGNLVSAEDVQRFHNETQAASRLDHPHIVPVYEIGETAGQHYFTMALATGGSLQQRVREGPLPPRVAAQLVQQIAEAVQHAHDQGILHRDIKPHNILLFSGEAQAKDGSSVGSKPSNSGPGAAPVPRLADFGLARLREDSEMTRTGQVLGTPSYMPPEQTRMDRTQVGPASDVYGLGAVLYCLLTGRPPFQAADPVETMRQVREEEPVPPRTLNPGVPQDLESVCLRCLNKEPKQRYGTARQLVDDLARYLGGKPTMARPVGALERGWRWCRRNAVVAALIAAVFVTLMLGASVGTGLAFYALAEKNRADTKADLAIKEADRADKAAEKADEAAQQARKDRDRAEVEKKKADAAFEQARKDRDRAEDEKKNAEDEKKYKEKELGRAEWALYLNRITLAHLEWQSGSAVSMREYLNGCQRNLRGWEYDYLDARLNKNSLKGHTGSIYSVGFSPDGKRIVSGSRDGTVKVWDAETNTEALTLKGHTEAVTSVGFSPDGKRIVSGSDDRTVKVWDVETSTETLTLKGHTEAVTSVAFSPNGKRIVSASKDKTAKMWDAEKGTEFLTLKGHTEAVYSLAFSADGKHIVSGSSDGTVKFWDAENGTETFNFKGHTRAVYSVGLSPDGKRIVVAEPNVAADGTFLAFRKGVSSDRESTIVPDLISNDNTVKVWNVEKGTETFTLKGHTGRVFSVAFSQDGKRIVSASADGTVKVWDAEKGTETLTFKGHLGSVYSVAFSADGKRIVSGSFDNTVKVWDAERGTETHTIKVNTNSVCSMGFSADGKRIVCGNWDGTVTVWDTDKGTKLLTLIKQHTDRVNSVEFSADGKRIVSGSFDNTVKIWDAEKGTETLTLEGHRGPVYSAAFSADGNRIVSCSLDFTVKVWDAKKGTETLTLRSTDSSLSPPNFPTRVIFSPDGKRIVSGNKDGTLTVWDTKKKGTKFLTLIKQHTGLVTSIGFSADGKRIVSGSFDNTVKVCDAEKGTETFLLRGHTGGVSCVASSPDGKRMVSASADGTVKVWEPDKGSETLTLNGNTNSVISVRFSADGKRIISGSKDGTVKVWDADQEMK